ncbi:diaminopimelate decarboxylase [Intestinibaculum porci]|jgi:diaminopimelate decarboxylase|uniref:Diaminopimelate decarboxylase n=1 Tax=Intestinibaculum porci TaxID=2487118 RepID=A0A3G9JSJ4_9FIRM|nr:diaminopimelate decarboxylase [Intestinibaculum porci]MDD6349110.1 diaminopimelate decarboxylase [Intestinibaculum porci]MDD6421552.1 diaminopimelate decarboxylase [Intestinibaculum porci]BBH28053.1 diaminopimelate decarboxylase [Intestinibaculum porci]HAN59005.1 diaminopimelate decarboxylase [Erysipelotrichaceae bacterium]
MVLQTKFATIKGNDLYIDGVKATDLASQYGTPLYVMSEGHIRQQMNELKTKFLDKYENALPLFASKSFSCLAIYKLASEYGIGIDCVSAGEISIALKAGFDPDKIYFHGNNKLPSEIEYALSHDVTHFVIDNFYEIELCEKIAGELGKKVKATVRVVPGIKAGGHNFIMTGHKDTKFGFSSHYGIYLKAIAKILNSENIEYEGLHAHIGSQVFDLYAYISAMNKFMGFVDEIYENFGVVTSKVNAGGGYGIAYNKNDEPLDFEVITSEIMKVIYGHYDEKGWAHPAVMIEPGRYVVGNAGITLYTVGAIKEIPDVRTYVSVDGGMADNIRTALYDADYDGIVANKAGETKTKNVRVAGKCCESGDIVVKDVNVTANIMPGDIFAVFTTGAYNYTMSSNYNQLPKPAVVFTYEGKTKCVIRRQTFDDLVAYDVTEDYK